MAVLPVPSHDDQWKDFSGLYSKGLKQSHPGIPDRTVYAAFIKEMDRGSRRRRGASCQPATV